MNSNLRRRRGYTIIELLVVLVSILIILALLFPMFKKMRDQGKKIKCLSNLKQIGVATQLYMQDDAQGRFPGWTETGGGCEEVDHLPALLWSYLGQENQNALTSGELPIFRCPSNTLNTNLLERQDGWGNQVDFSINCNLMNQQSVSKIGNDTISVLLYDYGVDNGINIHSEGANFLFVDGHAEWLKASVISSSWPGITQYAGADYEDWGLK